MSVGIWYFGDAGTYVSAVSGLAGALIGGAIAGVVSLKVAREARAQSERSWMRDSRRDIYDRFLAAGQSLLAVMERTAESAKVRNESHAAKVQGESGAALDAAYAAYFETYASVQTVAELRVVKFAREHAYLLQALKHILDGRGPLTLAQFDEIAEWASDARRDAIDAMRADLELLGSAKPPVGYGYPEVVEAACKGQRLRHP